MWGKFSYLFFLRKSFRSAICRQHFYALCYLRFATKFLMDISGEGKGCCWRGEMRQKVNLRSIFLQSGQKLDSAFKWKAEAVGLEGHFIFQIPGLFGDPWNSLRIAPEKHMCGSGRCYCFSSDEHCDPSCFH